MKRKKKVDAPIVPVVSIEPKKTILTPILKPQDLVKITINDGSPVLTEAGFPFQVAFDDSVAKKKPTHVLIIDIIDNVFVSEERAFNDRVSNRTLRKLEPVDTFQCDRSGTHHLIFIFIKDVNKTKRIHYLADGLRFGQYNSSLWFHEIEMNSLDGQVAYAEYIIDVPKELFAPRPQTAFGKALWTWTNRWYKEDPKNDCKIGKRMPLALTLQPIVWVIGFLIRLAVVAVIIGFLILRTSVSLLSGHQPMKIIPNKRLLFWKFLVLWQMGSTGEIFRWKTWFGYNSYEHSNFNDAGFYYYKFLAIGEKRIYLRITLLELMFYTFAVYSLYWMEVKFLSVTGNGLLWTDWSGALFCMIGISALAFSSCAIFSYSTLRTISNSEKWENKCEKKNNKLLYRSFIFPSLVLTALGVISWVVWMLAHVPWSSIPENTVDVAHSVRNVSHNSSFPYIVGAILLVVLIKYRRYINIFEWLGLLFTIIYGVCWQIKLFFFPDKDTQSINSEPKPIPVPVDPELEQLLANFSLENLPDKVDLLNAPESPGIRGLIHTFKVDYKTFKGKVCKPYDKRN